MLRPLTLAAVLILGIFVGNQEIAQVPPAQTADTVGDTAIDVRITGVRNTNGQIVLYLWKAPGGFPTKSEQCAKVTTLAASKAVNGMITATFAVAPGTYAVTVLHDENSNGKMDSNALGIPKEGYGASNNPATHFHAPSFDQAKFQLPASGRQIRIAMRY